MQPPVVRSLPRAEAGGEAVPPAPGRPGVGPESVRGRPGLGSVREAGRRSVSERAAFHGRRGGTQLTQSDRDVS